MNDYSSKKTERTRRAEEVLRRVFPDTEAYEQNRVSIRIRVVDEKFRNQSRVEREKMVYPLIRTLPEDIQDDISILLLLTPDQKAGHLLNLEFEDPTQSALL